MGEGTATTTPKLGRRRIIERPRLIRMLDESPERIKLLVAPAGYGKTTLARQWLASRPAATYALGAEASDVAAVAAGFCRAISGLVQGAGSAVLERISVTPRPEEEIDVLAAMLRTELQSWHNDHWLLLDDYHLVAPGSPSDRLIEAALAGASINTLIVGRTRPSWVSSRRLLYGEVYELSRDELAMTPGEARDLLGTSRPDADHLIRVAAGWPAVLSLGSATSGAVPEFESLPHLYGFFAEEIYQRVPKTAQKTLCELALHDGDISGALSSVEIDDETKRAAIDGGFLLDQPGEMKVHPLLRSFLEGKLRTDFASDAGEVVCKVCDLFMRNARWDEAYAVIARFGMDELIPNLIDQALPSLLEAGRTATLRTWLDRAPEDAHTVRVALAELAFREGRFYESEVLAEAAARDPSADLAASTRAWITAGRAAHAASRLEDALAHYTHAADSAPAESLRRTALLGQLGALNELERGDAAREVLDLLDRLDDLPPADRVILAGRRLNLDSHTVGYASLESAAAAAQLLGSVKDPVARSSFRNVYGYALVSACQIDEALRITEEQLLDVERCRLDFVIPYALVIQALAQYLRHSYSLAASTIDEALERASASHDSTATGVALAAQGRILNAQGAFGETLRRAASTTTADAKWIQAEAQAVHAIAHAVAGDVTTAQQAIAAAEELSASPEARISAMIARCILTHRSGDLEGSIAGAEKVLHAVESSRIVEVFVSAYRGWPHLILLLFANPANHASITQILTAAGDGDLAAAAPGARSALDLTKREKEVLSLVAQGLSNREIAMRLFISPTTAKLHVHHIFEKLGVKSRAEAALRGAQLGRHATAADASTPP